VVPGLIERRIDRTRAMMVSKRARAGVSLKPTGGGTDPGKREVAHGHAVEMNLSYRVGSRERADRL
jgi:hypothetical protein